MDGLRYLDFDVQIEKAGERFQVQVLDSPAGESSASFILPFSEDRIENLILRMGALRRGTRSGSVIELAAAMELGAGLFESVFSGEVLAGLRSSIDRARQQEDVGLRVKLRLQDAPELASLPWEFLYDRSFNRFLAQSNYTPIVRYMELPQRIRPLRTALPLRVLVMASSPHDPDYPELDVALERSRLEAALAPLVAAGRVQIDWIASATLGELQQQLRRTQYHVFHFIGHGAFDEATQQSVLILEDDQRRGQRVGAHRLVPLLHDHPSLRLAMLNSCEGARSSRTDPFAGMAAALIQQGVPATIAMQFEISDEAAIVFAGDFYSALASGLPVDASVAEARKSVLARINNMEWGTPVLYMRADDGVLFDLDLTSVALAPAPPSTVAEPAIPATLAPRAENTIVAPATAEVVESPLPLTLQLRARSPGGLLAGWRPSRFDLVLRNPNPQSVEAELSAADPEASSRLLLPRTALVPANGSISVRLEAQPLQRRSSGERRERHFTVSAAAGDGGLPPSTIEGSYPDAPRSWRPLAGGGLLGLTAVAAIAASQLLGSSSPVTPEVPRANRIVFTSDRDGSEQIYIMDEDGTGVARLTDGPGESRQPSAELYERRIVFVSTRDGGSELYTMKVHEGDVARVLTIEGTKLNPSISPGGERIAFELKNAAQKSDIYVVDVDGRNLTNLTRSDGADDREPAWSGDGERIAFSSDRGGNFDIWIMHADGTDQERVTYESAEDREPAWSSYDDYIAFSSDRTGSFQIWVMNGDGTDVARVTNGPGADRRPSWSPDLAHLAFASTRDGVTQIYVIDPDGSRQRRISDGPGNNSSPFSFFPPLEPGP